MSEILFSTMNREEVSMSRPPFLDGFNYRYWKTKLCVFIMLIDEDTWTCVLNSWTELAVITIDGKKKKG